jgi:predicted dehydrogenase
MDAFAGILLEAQQPPVPVDGVEAVKDLKIIDAIYQSARTGKKIPLSL